jgi:hypothetical protein
MDSGVPLVNAFIIGVMKSGTTSLARYLARHPDVCLCDKKEAHIFDQRRWQKNGVTADIVSTKFSSFSGEKIVLDATPTYVFAPGAIEAILRYNPASRFILILRSPVDRTISHYGHTTRAGGERRALLTALLLEPWRLWRESRTNPLGPVFRHRSYVARSLYFRQVRRLLSLTENVLILNFDELINDYSTVVARVCGFLGIDDDQLDGEFPHLHSRTPERNFRFERVALGLRLSRDARRTERLLGWPKYSLSSKFGMTSRPPSR